MSSTPTDDSIDRIRAWRKAAGWSINRLGSECGLNESTLRDIDGKGWNPRAETLRKLEAVIPAGWQPGDEIPAAPFATLPAAAPQGEGL